MKPGVPLTVPNTCIVQWSAYVFGLLGEDLLGTYTLIVALEDQRDGGEEVEKKQERLAWHTGPHVGKE